MAAHGLGDDRSIRPTGMSGPGRASFACRHQTSGTLSHARQGGAARPDHPQSSRRLAVRAPDDRSPLTAGLRRDLAHRKPRRLGARFLRRAVSWYVSHGITVKRVISDNGNGYRSFAWRDECDQLGIQRRYTRPRRPQTNGKAEALVKTLLREWAHRLAYPTSSHRTRALSGNLR